ncbi:MAG: hypothetical protein U0Q16_05520 [Bryobacteraceae bacterium]
MRKLIFITFSLALLAQRDRDGEGRRGFGGPGGEGRPSFMRMHPVLAAIDADHDGVITAEERAAAPRVLKGLDKNGDGVLSGEELRPQFRGGPGERGGEQRANSADMVNNLMAFDRNGDGVLEKEEVPERMQGLFARGDTNKDGKLTRDELTKLASAQSSPGEGRRGEGGRGEGGRGEGGRGGPGGFRDPITAALDTDGDGTVSQAEIANSAQSLAKLDRNNDGRITEEEVRPNFGPGGPGGRRNPAEMASRMMEEWDANGDGKLTKNELPERMQERFGDADKNGDGWLSKEELTAMLTSAFGGERR